MYYSKGIKMVFLIWNIFLFLIFCKDSVLFIVANTYVTACIFKWDNFTIIKQLSYCRVSAEEKARLQRLKDLKMKQAEVEAERIKKRVSCYLIIYLFINFNQIHECNLLILYSKKKNLEHSPTATKVLQGLPWTRTHPLLGTLPHWGWIILSSMHLLTTTIITTTMDIAQVRPVLEVIISNK